LSLSRVPREGFTDRRTCQDNLTMISAKVCGFGLLLCLGTMSAGQTSPPSRPLSELRAEVIQRSGTRFGTIVRPDGKRTGYNQAHPRLIPDWQPSADVPYPASVLHVE